jgi:hypothetical protein
MSHVTTMKFKVDNLLALKMAAEAIGLEFRENQHHYKWWGRHVGDYALPEGFKAANLGKCEHAIGIPNNNKAYEVGVCKDPSGNGYVLLWDFYGGGLGLEAAVGKDGYRLTQEYSVQVAIMQAQLDGMEVISRSVNSEGEVVLEIQ